MKAIYYADDDILEIRLSDAPIVKETSQGWNINLSFDAGGNLVELVVLEAREAGLLPTLLDTRKAA
ncbi:DUF2283 domain-containing protein [uncultured Thiodictyon sp.]|jgi:hypothetical protein|uniref:DUF2283 domain-containing protein n=1 Tax=uncultured Thiodictyon sp. TaxID=1846217 RepID=UPI0025E6A06D|nr:DUF2283 domain-containing protein [uncultured Thiodictyon sp.]